MAQSTLREIYLTKKSKNPLYSTRAFARDLGVSQTYISLLLTGKRKLPLRLAEKVAESLHLDEQERESLLASCEALPSIDADQIEVDRFKMIQRWYHLPILDLTMTKGFKPDVKWIARRLGIETIEAQDAVDRLVRLEFLTINGGHWRKTSGHLYIPTVRSKAAVRNFHKEMLAQAALALDNTSASAFASREISSITIAANPNRVAEARKRIQKFQKELAAFLSEGTRTEVYQLNIQMFPLTTKES